MSSVVTAAARPPRQKKCFGSRRKKERKKKHHLRQQLLKKEDIALRCWRSSSISLGRVRSSMPLANSVHILSLQETRRRRRSFYTSRHCVSCLSLSLMLRGEKKGPCLSVYQCLWCAGLLFFFAYIFFYICGTTSAACARSDNIYIFSPMQQWGRRRSVAPGSSSSSVQIAYTIM